MSVKFADDTISYESSDVDTSYSMKEKEMLGYAVTGDGSAIDNFLREEMCAFCGIEHKNRALLDIYAYCPNCQNCLREPAVLRKKYDGLPQKYKLDILIACYGDATDASLAIDVTNKLIEMVEEYETRDRLSFRKSVPLDSIFGNDPSPGNVKQLSFRYRINMLHGHIVLPVSADNRLSEPMLLICPEERQLTIMKGSFGHPIGKSAAGRMSYDV